MIITQKLENSMWLVTDTVKQSAETTTSINNARLLNIAAKGISDSSNAVMTLQQKQQNLNFKISKLGIEEGYPVIPNTNPVQYLMDNPQQARTGQSLQDELNEAVGNEMIWNDALLSYQEKKAYYEEVAGQTNPMNPNTVDLLFQEIIKQTLGVGSLDDIEGKDRPVVNAYSDTGVYTDNITGLYPNTQVGRSLYDEMGWPCGASTECTMQQVFNECMQQGVYYDELTDTFKK